MTTLTPTTAPDVEQAGQPESAAPAPTTAQRHRWLCGKLAAQARVLHRIGQVGWGWHSAAMATSLAERTSQLLAEVADQPASLHTESRLAMHADTQRRYIAAWHEFCGHDASISDTRREAVQRAVEQRAARASRPEGYLRQHLASQCRALAAACRRSGDATTATAARLLAEHTRQGRISTAHAVSLSTGLSDRLMRMHLAAGHHDSVPAHLRPAPEGT